ncbi:MAG: hypothetical protein LBQ73_10305, partial [Tannerellaceae bacterium]|nr:hypothetical protein [Tannerellaceae bacterium]
MFRSKIIALLAVIQQLCVFPLYSETPNEPIVFKNGQATLVLEDHLKHPLYWWPQTLLSYDVLFDEAISEAQLILTDPISGKPFPFQLTDVKNLPQGKRQARLHLMSGLNSKEKRVFVLQKGISQSFPAVKVTEQDSYYQIQTGKYTVRIPASQPVGVQSIPAPVAAISMDGKNWMGTSFFKDTSNLANIRRLETKRIAEGPLFVTFELRYTFSNDAEYTATVRCVEGYEFVEIREQMKGFPERSSARWEIEWSNFHPTHRQAPNHPYGSPKANGKGFTRYDWETVGQTMLNSHHGIIKNTSTDGKIPFEAGIYGNWPAERNVTSSLFWDEQTNQSVGIFVQDIAYWDNRQYPVWHDPRIMSVKFYYQDKRLRWSYPLINGTRATALSVYPHQKDIDYMDRLEELIQNNKTPDGHTLWLSMSQYSHNSFLQNRYSTIDLNKVKDWVLTYPDTTSFPALCFDTAFIHSPENLEQFFYDSYSNALPTSGPCQNSGYGPPRGFYHAYTGMMNGWLPYLPAEQRERMIAIFLMHTYIAAGEDQMPMRHMLSGHPNFLSDVKTVPSFAAFLFPKHPKAEEWKDLFEKYIDLNTHYHSRPTVKSWDAMGGRWTENINTYVWGFLRPAIRANYLLRETDGKNRMANANTSRIAAYMLNTLSAPFNGEAIEPYMNAKGLRDTHSWGVVTKETGPKRLIPTQGAHSIRRSMPSGYWLFGKYLEHYDPLLSENIRYVARPEYEDAEMIYRDKNAFNFMYPLHTDDSGTPPDLQSVKMTGYGIVLRAAVGTKNELSIHLGQIDNGQNYRWGIVGEGGCGSIYFYAGGESYSNNGKEDVGDRRLQDTDLATNFGVFKDGRFKSVGRNELTRPMYDLTQGQFAEIISSEESGYSWPEYIGRSILLVGSDYFIVYDDLYNQNMATRFSWLTHPEDNLPELQVIKSGGANYVYTPEPPERISVTGRESKGVWFDGTGDMMTFVSHKKGYKSEPAPYGCIITSPAGMKDYIFRNDLPVEVDEPDRKFSGTAGFIRHRPEGEEWVIFHGTRIGNADFEIRPQDTDAGLSAVFTDKEHIGGKFYCLHPAKVTFKYCPENTLTRWFYIDGVKQAVSIQGGELTIDFPKGKHLWTLTAGLPDMPRPQIDYTRNRKGKVELGIQPVAAAQRYRCEYSTDAETWTTQKEQTGNIFLLQPVGRETKGYIRIMAVNRGKISEPSVIYPVYYTSAKPHYPDGLKLKIDGKQVTATWGKVLGCNEYKLYRRVEGGTWKVVYTGSGNQYKDTLPETSGIFGYAISASNGNGESALSNPVTTDPDSWLNFEPVKGEPFRR